MSAKSGEGIDQLRGLFPNLSGKAKVTSPQTPKYNCIAYAAGDTERWWWPESLLAYWPSGCLNTVSLLAFQMAFETLGYTLCASADFDPTVEKIALFQKDHKPTHAAKLIADGIWSSKLGKSFDISHDLSYALR